MPLILISPWHRVGTHSWRVRGFQPPPVSMPPCPPSSSSEQPGSSFWVTAWWAQQQVGPEKAVKWALEGEEGVEEGLVTGLAVCIIPERRWLWLYGLEGWRQYLQGCCAS